jgi:hypothetical protein
LLELDLTMSLRSLTVVDCVHKLLTKGGRQIMNAASLDQNSLNEAVEQVEKQITAQFSIEQRGAARRNQACSIRVDQPLERRTALQPSIKTVEPSRDIR